MFKKRENVKEIEEGKLLSPKFDNDGLIPVITTCVQLYLAIFSAILLMEIRLSSGSQLVYGVSHQIQRRLQ